MTGQDVDSLERRRIGRFRAVMAGSALFAFAAGTAVLLASATASAPAVAEQGTVKLPSPPANGEMGFVVENFSPAFMEDPQACPQGTSPKVRDAFLLSLPPEERARLSLKENEKELTQRYQASVFGPGGTNICSQPDRFDRPMLKTVQSTRGPGLDLDGDGKAQGCAHQEFVGPNGEPGIDNQAYRALACKLEWHGNDGKGGDNLRGYHQFLASGEWTQVLLLRGVDSLENDPDVEVIYGNTPDRPMVDSQGRFLPGASFTISTKPPRHRNVLHGRIVDGVLTTDPADIKLTQTWGQGGSQDLRGNRSRFDFRHARMRLAFQPDGSLRGLVGGYQPVFDLIISPALGGAGSAIAAGIDCAAELKTLKALADGIRDPKTGQCTGVSAAYQVSAVPSFVNDAPGTPTASR